MTGLSRRQHLEQLGGLVGAGALSGLAPPAFAADPRELKPVGFFTAGQYTRTHHLQVANDLLLLANGANIVAMQSYDTMSGYFENALADSITNRKKFRSGLSIHDISRPAEMREIAFLEMPGFGINRTHWTGGRDAYVSAHLDGFTD